jgi:hypothetical protein
VRNPATAGARQRAAVRRRRDEARHHGGARCALPGLPAPRRIAPDRCGAGT